VKYFRDVGFLTDNLDANDVTLDDDPDDDIPLIHLQIQTSFRIIRRDN